MLVFLAVFIFMIYPAVPATPNAVQQSIVTPKVHMLGETGAVIAYIRLIQSVNKWVTDGAMLLSCY